MIVKSTPDHHDDPDDGGDPRVTNLVLVAVFVLVIGAGYWLVDALLEQRRLDDCAAQGRRDCGRIVVPPR
ncbi:hypothetical protein [Rhodoplanes serenus]|uniref:hypothetical protein n=1 Tax=Rhodoplanes serenus TaxID=200615 RepID=UPI000DAC19DA|nr:hypothetical protein [Rhodoplanes serenus]RAI33182.1 hypothetical protein CH340_13105 [Rhodoplanes serenus]